MKKMETITVMVGYTLRSTSFLFINGLYGLLCAPLWLSCYLPTRLKRKAPPFGGRFSLASIRRSQLDGFEFSHSCHHNTTIEKWSPDFQLSHTVYN